MVSLKDQLWIHDYDWESCNDRKCDKDQESDDDQKPHNSGCCKKESEKTIDLSLFFRLRSFLDKEEEVGGRPCASNFEVPG